MKHNENPNKMTSIDCIQKKHWHFTKWIQFPQLSGISHNNGIFNSTNCIPVYSENPDNRGIGIFFSILVLRIYNNRGLDTQGPPICGHNRMYWVIILKHYHGLCLGT